MPGSQSVAEVERSHVDLLVDDGLPLVDLSEPAPAVDTTSGVRPFAYRFLTSYDEDPEFLRMSGEDVTFTFTNGNVKVDDL